MSEDRPVTVKDLENLVLALAPPKRDWVKWAGALMALLLATGGIFGSYFVMPRPEAVAAHQEFETQNKVQEQFNLQFQRNLDRLEAEKRDK